MAANANDLRWYYGPDLGATLVLSLSGVSAATPALEAGRYRVRFRNVAGAGTIWVRQGTENVEASTSAPSTPFDVATYPDGELFYTHVHSETIAGPQPNQARLYLAGITDAGTVDLVLTKVSRGRG